MSSSLFGIPDSDMAASSMPATLPSDQAALPNQAQQFFGVNFPAAAGHRPNHVLGGVERLVDETSEKLRENFLAFLERYREPSDSSNAASIFSQEISSHTPSTIGTSEMLLSTTQGSEPPLFAENQPLYRHQLVDMRQNGRNTIYIDFSHLVKFDQVLARAIQENFYRFESALRAAFQSFVLAHIPSYSRLENSPQHRDLWVSLYGSGSNLKLRELTTEKIGQLISVSGTVTRTSEVRPELYVGSFRCDECQAIIRGVEQQFRYTEPPMCTSPNCQNRTFWTLLPEESIFVNWQKIRIQENANEIPPGSMPRTLDVIVRNEMVERAKAGDKCTFTGCLIVVPDVTQLSLPGSKMEPSSGERGRRDARTGANEGVTGAKALGARELTYKLSFLACFIETETAQGAAALQDESVLEEKDETKAYNDEERLGFKEMSQNPELYNRLIESVAPAIYGHAEVKAGILLMLFGGVHKTTHEGIRLRGDINVCLVGDPGTAKSQFLRFVSGFLPRCVYTSGKASSAAGLTASVLKDEETGEFTIEAGALMLADNGICCIDEFDKMDISDQVAIHEAMEQQTISIAKAGIQATLNARASVLAAANPIGGRYDRRKTLRQNIAMTAPIMSRFDLFFVVLDESSESFDYNLSRHILNLHRYRDDAVVPPYSSEQLRKYIHYARMKNPKMTKEAAELLIEKYKQLRQSDMTGRGASYRVTVRQLESMIRLSEALARLHLDDYIQAQYVREAARLLKASIIRVESDAIDLTTGEFIHHLTTPARPIDVEPVEKLSLDHDEYVRISNMLVYHLRQRESEADANGSDDVDAASLGMTKSALAEWCLEQFENDINREAELELKGRQIMAVIERLIRKDKVLVEMRSDSAMEVDDKRHVDAIVVVHPNYVL